MTKDEIIEEQRNTIKVLNMCIGGEGSTTTENLTRISRLEAEIESLKQPAQEPVKKMYQSEHSEQWWKHEIDNARVDGYLKGRASGLKEAHPHQWQGLTDDESIELIEKCTDKTDGYFSHLAFSNAIQQAIAKKNGFEV